MKQLTINFLDEKYIEEFKEKYPSIKLKIIKPLKLNITQKYMMELPEYIPNNNFIFTKGIVSYEDPEIFNGIFYKKISNTVRYIYYPSPREELNEKKFYNSDLDIKPKYPLYIISKGRWETRLTSKSLEELNLDYKIVIEQSEYEKYSTVINPDKILIIPDEYFTKDVGGSIPARQFVWNHSLKEGHKKHWILDDNIRGFYRINNSAKYKLKTGIFFHIIEKYCDRFTNIGLSGMIEYKFAPSINQYRRKIFTENTRIFSCILVNTELLTEKNIEKWRGIYNEDADLSIRVLKAGLTTWLSNQFVINKMTTMSMKGGNTSGIYQGNGLSKKTDSLIKQHPDVVKRMFRFSKDHFYINYKTFKQNKYILKEDEIGENLINEYKMFIE